MTTTKWEWIVCFAVPFATILEATLPHSFGSFIAYFQTSTHLRLAELTWITATTSAIPCMLLPIFVTIVKRYKRFYRYLGVLSFITMSCSCFISSALQNVQFLFLTYTFIYGLSSALFLSVCIVIISDYFPVHHSHHILATSLYQIGYPVAAAAFSPLMAFFITSLGWQHALQILGGIQIIFGCSVALLFKPSDNTQEETGNVDKEDNSTQICRFWKCDRSCFVSRPQMYTWFIAKFLNYVCWFSMRTNLTPFLHWRGHTLIRSAFIMITYALGEISFCILAAFISRFLRGKLLFVHIFGTVGMAILMLTWSSLPAIYGVELLVAILIGIFVQITLTFGYPASAEILDWDMSTSWTITNVFAGIGILVSPVLGGVTFDSTSSFFVFFYAAGAAWVLQFVLHVFTYLILRFWKPSCDSYEAIS